MENFYLFFFTFYCCCRDLTYFAVETCNNSAWTQIGVDLRKEHTSNRGQSIAIKHYSGCDHLISHSLSVSFIHVLINLWFRLSFLLPKKFILLPHFFQLFLFLRNLCVYTIRKICLVAMSMFSFNLQTSITVQQLGGGGWTKDLTTFRVDHR